MTDSIITGGYGATDKIITGGYDTKYTLHSFNINDALTQLEKKQFTQSFFAPGFIEAGFDTTTPLTDFFKKGAV